MLLLCILDDEEDEDEILFRAYPVSNREDAEFRTPIRITIFGLRTRKATMATWWTDYGFETVRGRTAYSGVVPKVVCEGDL